VALAIYRVRSWSNRRRRSPSLASGPIPALAISTGCAATPCSHW